MKRARTYYLLAWKAGGYPISKLYLEEKQFFIDAVEDSEVLLLSRSNYENY
jgi:hypothetical protein